MDWFHVDPEALHPHEAVLTGEEWRHAFLASRHRAGDRIGLVDGLGNRGEAVIETVTAEEGRLRLLEWGPDPRERRGPYRLAVGLIRIARFEWLVEKGTEAGIHGFVPILSERAQSSLAERARRRRPRFREIARAAMKQSARSFWPEVLEPCRLENYLDSAKSGVLILADPEGEAWSTGPLREGLVTGFAGPEGGWTEAEIETLLHAGARRLRLSPFRLRTETAALALAFRMVESS